MSRVLALGQLICLLALGSAAFAQGDMIASSRHQAAVAYTGPGDIVTSGWVSWFGMRAFSAAYATSGGNAIQILRSSDSTNRNIAVLPNGSLDEATMATFCASTSCCVSGWYDQSGNGRNTTMGNTSTACGTVVTSCLGTHSCASYNGGASGLSTSGPALSQPWTYSVVATRTGSFTTAHAFYEQNHNNFAQFGPNAAANTVRLTSTAGTLTATAADSAWHAFQAIQNGATSSINVDGTTTSGNAGSTSFVNGSPDPIWGDGGNAFVGRGVEVGVNSTGISGANQTALCHNQYVYWGLPNAC